MRGDDLLHYPRHLETLERRLVRTLAVAGEDLTHLEHRKSDVAAMDQRRVLADRYTEEVAALKVRMALLRRVLAQIWHTRSVLQLQAQLAVTARHQPFLEELSVLTEPSAEQAERCEHAAFEVRRFSEHLAERIRDGSLQVPREPLDGTIGEELRANVEAERARVEKVYRRLHRDADRLADTLRYLADRHRARGSVLPQGSGEEQNLDLAKESHALVSEVDVALSGLHGLFQTGERHLVDAAVAHLEQDICQLEQVGLEAEAAAVTELEVARLLQDLQA
jgi:hypothetical protein